MEVDMRSSWLVAVFALGCTTYVEQLGPVPDGDRSPPGYDPTCDLGSHCNPHIMGSLPYAASGDTRSSAERHAETYSCSPGTREGGAEVWYAVEVAEAGRLVARIDEVSGDGVDVDVHILTDIDPDSCLARGDATASADVEPGFVFVVVDTWSGSSGKEYPGTFELEVEFHTVATGDCAVEASDLRMFWSSCAVGDCYMAGGEAYLQLPAIGPVVKEAHLVTVEDDFNGGWPTSFTHGISAHYALSEDASGYDMSRKEPWAPAGEGGSKYGQSATSVPLPVLDEAWYITMYWKDRPAKGTRMIVRNPANGRAVVASAGWETGPGSNTAIAGVTEEIHHYLGTGHLDDLEIGFAADDTLPLGPVTCGSSSPADPDPATTTDPDPATTPTSPSTGCPAGVTCVTGFPYTHASSTTGKASNLDAYSCAPGTDESGPEVVYQVEVSESGYLAGRLLGLPAGVDVDLHLLDGASASDCIDRGHWDAGVLVPPGTYYVVVDSWVSSSGDVKDGAYTLELNFTGFDDFAADGLDPDVLETALYAFDKAWSEGDLSRLEYGIVDYSLPSVDERMWVIDLANGDLLYKELVSHGSGSQDPSDMRYADRFSNTSGSNMSSIGLAVAAETYYGSHGYSLRLDGLESGYNSNDRSRAIVVHSATYSTQDFVDDYGYLGRSNGCPAVDPAISDGLIDAIKEGGGLFKYYPDSGWLSNSYYLSEM